MKSLHLTAIIAGLASSSLFLGMAVLGLSVPLMLLPTLPLMMLGLRYGAQPLLTAIGAALLPTLLLTGVSATVFYAALIVLPCLLFAPRCLLRVSDAEGNTQWMPIAPLLVDLVIFAALCSLAIIVYLIPQGGVPEVLAANMRKALPDMDAELQPMMDLLTGELSFFIVAASAWWWILLVYVHALIANQLLLMRKQAVRPSITLTPFRLPAVWLGVLAATALVSLLADGNIAFAGKTLLIIFLLPYFLLGISILHQTVKSWPARGLLLFLVYFLTLTQAWPALLLSGYGVWRQCRDLSVRAAS